MANRYLELEDALRRRVEPPAADVRYPAQASLRSGPRAVSFSGLSRSGLRARSFAVALPGSVVERTKRFEASIGWMYLDTRGKVTVGVGHMIPSADSAAALGFVRNSDGAAATDKQKRDEFAVILGKERDKVATFYKQHTTMTLPQPEIDSMLTADLEYVVTRLKARLSDYDTYPTSVQEALVDMMFNLGESGLMNEFPKFVTAVKKRDWKAAAAESKRRGPSDDRNHEIRKLLEAAAAP